MTRMITAGLAAAFVFGSAPLMAQSDTEGPAVKATLLADKTGVTPGGEVTLALKFEIPDEWHIYWRYGGDSGFPPKVQWTLPAGASVGELQFPTPTKHVDKIGQVTYILEYEPVLLATLTAPKDAKPGDTLKIAGDVTYLVCKTLCIPQARDVSLELPVVASAADAKPANADLFESARYALPAGPKDDEHVKIETKLSQSALRPGDKAEAAVILDIAKNHHVQSNTPASEFFIPTELIIEPIDGLLLGEPVFPKPNIHTDVNGEKQSEFNGKAVIRVPLEAEAALKGKPVLRGLVTFQTCNDQTGQCYAPVTVEWSLPLPLAAKGAAVEQTNKDVFAAAGSTTGGDGGGDSAGGDTDLASVGGNPELPLWRVLLFAFIGGAILNIMPCVLPVISIKILSFVQQAGEDRKRIFLLGLTYTIGILASFLAMAIVLVILRSQGRGAGWGFMLANATFVQILILVVFAFGLSLLGVFTITLPGSAMTSLAGAEQKEGYPGAFFKGVLAVALATPCTAPLLAPALGVAFVLPPALMVLALMTVGLGLAAPYLLLSAVPAWMKFLPKPGLWMERFKQLMGFLLMGTVVWLLWILQQLVEPSPFIMTIAFLCILALALWMIGLITPSTETMRRAVLWLTAILIAIGGAYWCFTPPPPGIDWKKWELGKPEALAAQGYTVYVDFTARWCATCQSNKALVLETEPIRREIDELHVVMLKGDYTHNSPVITEELRKYGRAGVPLNIIYPAHHPDDPILLPELLTQGVVLERLKQAGPSDAGLDEVEPADDEGAPTKLAGAAAQ